MPRFFTRYELALRANSQLAVDEGRLTAKLPVKIEDSAGETEEVQAQYQLMRPDDVERLAPGAIVRRFPAPGAGDAEVTKFAHVEFDALDLPWRYTPSLPNDDGNLLPWLVLIVGVKGADGVTVRPDGTVRIAQAVQDEHKLVESWRWAHVQKVDKLERSRLICPKRLDSDTSYVAVLIKAFADGTDAWTAASKKPPTCLDHWEFRTGPKGDFRELASQLKRADLADLALRGGRPFGRADLCYSPRDGGPASTLSTAGALRVPSASTPDPADAPPPAAVAADVAALQTPILVADGRDVITAPDYPGAFLSAEAALPSSDGWVAQLRQDPRLRGAAGLGAWTAIAWQNRISDAAATKLGDTLLGAERIRALALGVMVSRSLWERRVPDDPVQALVALSAGLGRLPTDAGGTVLDAVVGHATQLSPVLFSSAARRAARPGPARAVLAKPAAGNLAQLLNLAANCPDPIEPPDVLARRERQPNAGGAAVVKRAVLAASSDPQAIDLALSGLLDGGMPSPGRLAAVLAALAPSRDGRTNLDAVQDALRRHEVELADPTEEWVNRVDRWAPPCARVDLVALGKAVLNAIDPTVEEPPAARRVYATLPGVRSMRPLEVEPELDIPLWSFLSKESPDWMLPGVGHLAEHEVIGVETNPMFVRALLLGANVQAASELRWRNVPLVPRSSPLRRFWQRIPGVAPDGGPDDVYDIKPVRFWPIDASLGVPELSPKPRGSEAVVVFKSPIFRRYPTTAVYLYDARPDPENAPEQAPNWNVPPAAAQPLNKPRRIDSTFTGTIGPDVTFFGFPVPASALLNHWVVLEEPPPGYRFYNDEQAVAPADPDHSARFAVRHFALPVRVLIGPLL
jgi:hypothetical protein